MTTTYDFETASRKTEQRPYRQTADAEKEVARLKQRLAPKKPAVFEELVTKTGTGPLLIKWGIELPLNLRWYVIELAKLKYFRSQTVLVATLVSILAIVAVTGLTFVSSESAATMFGAQAGFLLTGLFLAMQVFSAATDVKANIGIYWEASANLKDALYAFEERWAGLEWTEQQMVEFKTDLRALIKLGRNETRRERTERFRNMKSASDVLGAGLAALDQLRGKQKAYYEERRKILEGAPGESALAAREVERAHLTLVAAKGALDAARFANENTKARGEAKLPYDEPALVALQHAVDAATAELNRRERQHQTDR